MLQAFDERNRDLVVNVGGRLTHRDRAGVSPFDSAVQGGDAVWEGLRLYDGKVFRLDEHLARLRASARALAFARIPSDDEITEQIRRTLAANGMRDGVHIRLTLTRGVKVTSGMDPRLNQAGPTLIVLADSAGIGCEVGDYTLTQLYNADEAFVTGTMGGLAPVLCVDGRTIGDGTPGPVTKRLTALYADLTAATGTPVT